MSEVFDQEALNKEAEEEKIIADAAKAEIANQLGGELSPEESESVSTEKQESSNDDGEQAQSEESDDDDKPAALFAGYTEDEIKSALGSIGKLQRALDTTNGRYGNELQVLKKTIETMQQQRKSVFDGISPEKLKRLHADYPEMAQLLAEDLSDISKPNKETVITQETKNAGEKSQKYDTVLSEVEQLKADNRARAIRDLAANHPDWEDVAAWGKVPVSETESVIKWANPLFGAWVQSQSEDVQNQIFNGNDADYLSGKISEFKATIAPKTEETVETQNETKLKPDPKRKLEKALLPKGTKTQNQGVLSEDDIIEKAMREEMKRNMGG